MRNLLIVFFVLLGTCKTFGQVVISGKVVDKSKKAISGVMVSYNKIGESRLLGFTQTNEGGEFSLQFELAQTDSIEIGIRHMSYTSLSDVAANKSGDYTYILEEQTRLIKEVNVKDRDIYRRKDTINYSVESFTSKQDRVIGDIIRKLPGIEMEGDRILYQGKPIQKYMVNNLDLMEGRYGMINNNLPADAVKKVQVVENDQPIKILDSLVFSDRASLNLELKKFTTTGTGKIGVGLTPALWDINLTPMTFGKTFQMLTSFQSNNVGYDASKNLNPYYVGSGAVFGSYASIKNGPAYIHLRNVSSPGFDAKKWLDNKLFLFSGNMLQKFNNEVVVKGNISYFDDTRRRQGFTATHYFTDEEIIYTDESIDNRYRFNVFDAGVLLEKNEKKIYLRNNFKYHKRWNNDQGRLLFDEDDLIDQRTHYTDEALLNDLSFARFIGKQLVSIRSTMEWHRTPQHLTVSPGQFQDILNNGNPYENMVQRIVYKGLRWENSLSFSRRFKRWIFSPNIGLNYNQSHLDSYIHVNDQGNQEKLGEGYLNDMFNTHLNFSPQMRINWEHRKWKMNLTLPYNMYSFNVKQQEVRKMDNELRHTFNPSANMIYMLNSRNEFSTQISAGSQYGGLDNFYNGYIISQYRSMQRYDARLLRTDSRSARVSYNYKNTLKANFANFSYRYSQSERDYIFKTQIDAMGRTTTSIADQNSASANHNLSAGISRFFSSIKTIAKLNGNLGWNTSDYLLNDILSTQYVQQQSGTLEVINNLSAVVSGDYKTTIGRSTHKFEGNRRNTVFYNNHYLNLVVYPHDRHSLAFSNSLYRNNIEGQRDQFFMDLMYRYRVEKWRTDIEFGAQNLLNNNRYIQQFSNNIELVQSYFELRPRQILISTRFKF